MDPNGPDDRPSIFNLPDADETAMWRRERPSAPYLPPPRSPTPPTTTGPNRRVLAAAGGGALVVMLVAALVVTGVLGPRGEVAADASPDPSASATASPSVEPTPSASATPTPMATPEPTPAGPPQDVAVGAWATVVVDELTVRSAAGTDAPSQAILVRGAIANVAEGPIVVANLNWYRITSLGGTGGWVSSGWVAEPFMTTLVDDPTLIRCGLVGQPVFDESNAGLTPHDPLVVGDFALPVAKFSDLALGAIELLRGTGQEVCFTAQLGADGVPAIGVQLNVDACGHAVLDGGVYHLRPAAGQPVPAEVQIKDPAAVHPAVLVGGRADQRMSSNLAMALAMMSAPGATGCVHVGVTEGAGLAATAFRGADASLCAVVTEYNADNLRMRPTAGGDELWFKLSSANYQPDIFALNTPTTVNVNVHAGPDGPGAWVYSGYGDSCS